MGGFIDLETRVDIFLSFAGNFRLSIKRNYWIGCSICDGEKK